MMLSRAFRLGDAVVEPAMNEILRDGQVHEIERQVMRILLLLARHEGEVVERETILNEIWTDSTPNDEGLTQAISKLRKALGDTPRDGRHIQTIRKVGYRLRGPVEAAVDAVTRAETDRGPAPRMRPPSSHPLQRWFAAAVSIAMLSTSALAVVLTGTATQAEPEPATLTSIRELADGRKEVKIRIAIPAHQLGDLAAIPADSIESRVRVRRLPTGMVAP